APPPEGPVSVSISVPVRAAISGLPCECVPCRDFSAMPRLLKVVAAARRQCGEFAGRAVSNRGPVDSPSLSITRPEINQDCRQDETPAINSLSREQRKKPMRDETATRAVKNHPKFRRHTSENRCSAAGPLGLGAFPGGLRRDGTGGQNRVGMEGSRPRSSS
ncbi:hypothetical protein, partial [Frankia tisae]